MKLAGIDLNGIHDYCMRSETPGTLPRIGPESKSNERPDSDFKIDGGAFSVAVRTGYADDAQVVAGPQAALAPHGRGLGWGEIGDRQRRIRIAEALRMLEKSECAAGSGRVFTRMQSQPPWIPSQGTLTLPCS